MGILPVEKIRAEIKNPKKLIIFSKPKMGKTTILSLLENCLILDFEDGSDYVDALKVKIIGIGLPKGESSEDKEDRVKHNKFYLAEIGQAIREAVTPPYDYIAVDTVSGLEDMCVSYAEELYSKTPIGKYWFTPNPQNADPCGKDKYGNILALPEGAGYYWLRVAFEKVLNFIYPLAKYTILSGHLKDIKLERLGVEFTAADLDLVGKLKNIAAYKADAIAYLTRKGKKTILSFKSSDTIACGARPDHLKGQDIVIAEQDEDGNIEAFWDRVFLPETIKTKKETVK